jgi:hypothetical protein
MTRTRTRQGAGHAAGGSQAPAPCAPAARPGLRSLAVSGPPRLPANEDACRRTSRAVRRRGTGGRVRQTTAGWRSPGTRRRGRQRRTRRQTLRRRTDAPYTGARIGGLGCAPPTPCASPGRRAVRPVACPAQPVPGEGGTGVASRAPAWHRHDVSTAPLGRAPADGGLPGPARTPASSPPTARAGLVGGGLAPPARAAPQGSPEPRRPA